MNALALTTLICAFAAMLYAFVYLAVVVWDIVSDMLANPMHPLKLGTRGGAAGLGTTLLLLLGYFMVKLFNYIIFSL